MATNSPALVLPAPSPAATNAATNDLRALRPPVDIPSPWTWLWVTLGVLALAALGWWVWRKWLRKVVIPPLPPPVPPHVRARRKLEEALKLLTEPRLFCIAVSDTLRVYLEERFTFRAPERTTEEFLLELQATNLLTPEQKQALGGFLSRCDLVKFARYEPTEVELGALHAAALRLVNDTEPPPEFVESAIGNRQSAIA